ncbi:MAG: hypothetical protein ACKOAX_02540 [Candidatus Kapaibacterium sp.]
MNISEDTLAVVDYLETSTNTSLRKKNDMLAILELAALSLDADVVAHLGFHGAAVWRIFSVMRKSQPGSESFVKLEQEFAASLNEMRVGLLAVMEQADEEITGRFHDVYLGMSGGVARNLTDLAHDFSRFKEMQNAVRRSTGAGSGDHGTDDVAGA